MRYAPRPAMLPLASTLHRCRSRVDRRLIPDAAWDRLLALGERLPAALTSRLYLECRPAHPEGRADLVLAVDAPGRRILRGDNPAVPPPFDAAADDATPWRHLAGLCRRAHREPRLGALLRRPWLEFDLPEALSSTRTVPTADGLPPPGLFLELARRPAGVRSAGEWRRRLGELLGPLAAEGVRELASAHLEACWAGTAEDVATYALGLFPGRGAPHLRSCLYADHLLDDARRRRRLLGPVVAGELESRVARHPVLAARRPQLLHIELDGRGDGVIGLEWRLPAAADGTPRRAALRLLRHLADAGLLPADLAERLLSWPGAEVERLAHELWPSVVRRSLNHVKVVLARDRAAESKVYLLQQHAPRRAVRGAPAGSAG